MGKKKKAEKALQAILAQALEPNRTDVLGSWTGVPIDPSETPVQDADDL